MTHCNGKVRRVHKAVHTASDMVDAPSRLVRVIYLRLLCFTGNVVSNKSLILYPGMVAYTWNFGMQEDQTGGLPGVQGQAKI